MVVAISVRANKSAAPVCPHDAAAEVSGVVTKSVCKNSTPLKTTATLSATPAAKPLFHMNRFRTVRRAYWLPSLGIAFAAIGCDGQVGEPLTTSSDNTSASTTATASESVENPRPAHSAGNVGVTNGASSTTPTATFTSPPTTFPRPTASTDGETFTSSEETNATTASWSEPTSSSEIVTSSDTSETSSESTAVPQKPSEFNITLEFLGNTSQLSDSVRAAFVEAEAFWENVIIGDLPDVEVRFRQACVPDQGAYVEGTIDDLHIFVAARDIDGVDGVLGAAGPCLSHASRNNLPLAGYMEFDTADLQRYANEGPLGEN